MPSSTEFAFPTVKMPGTSSFTLVLLVGLVGDTADTVYTISKDVEVVPSFDAMGLNPDLLRGIYAYGRFLWVKFPNSRFE